MFQFSWYLSKVIWKETKRLSTNFVALFLKKLLPTVFLNLQQSYFLSRIQQFYEKQQSDFIHL